MSRRRRSGDAAATAAALEDYSAAVEQIDAEMGINNRVYPAPGGEFFAVSAGPDGFMITLGAGVTSRAPMGGLGSTGEWRFGSEYWSLHGGTTPTRAHMVYQPPSMRLVNVTTVLGGNYEYLEEPRLLIWPTTLDERRIDYPLVDGPSNEPNLAQVAPGLERWALPCLMVFDFADEEHIQAATPDISTLQPRESASWIFDVILKPTTAFTADELFEVVSQSDIYRKYVGKQIGCSSE